MIIFLNGSFGVGKTTVAKLLVERLPQAQLYDPELVGAILRMMTNGVRSGAEDSDDFQDIALWRTVTVELAGHLRRAYGRTLVIPMTVTRPDYFAELTVGLRQVDAEFHHFCLLASAETLRNRLLARGETEGSWVFDQLDRCMTMLPRPEFAEHVETDGISAEKIADKIISQL